MTSKSPKWHLLGHDTFINDDYSLGWPAGEDGRGRYDGMKPEYDSYEEALADARKRLAHLEGTQPTSGSGGQAYGGIQDQVYIVHPDGHRERVS